MERTEQMTLDAQTVGGLVMLNSCKGILRGKTEYFYQKCEVDAIVNAIAMPLDIKPMLDDCHETMGWAIKLKEA